MNLQSIKSRVAGRIDRKLAVLVAVFAIALSGTGMASLAILHDNVSIAISGTATTIDFKANGTKTFAADFGLVLRGDVRFLPLQLSNSGTGYVSIVQADATPLTNGTQISTATKAVVYPNVSAANCNTAGGVEPTAAQWTAAQTVANVPLFTNAVLTIPAGGSLDFCAVYQVGGDASGGAFPTGQTLLDLSYSLHGFYP